MEIKTTMACFKLAFFIFRLLSSLQKLSGFFAAKSIIGSMLCLTYPIRLLTRIQGVNKLNMKYGGKGITGCK